MLLVWAPEKCYCFPAQKGVTGLMSSSRIRVALLDDHQSVIDGYHYRLEKEPQIEIAGAAHNGAALEELLARTPVDLVILDVSVPTSAANLQPYPVLYAIPSLRQQYPNLAVLVISMMAERALVKAVLEAGARGYILKDDLASITDLAAIVLAVARGGMHLSEQVSAMLSEAGSRPGDPELTPRQLEAISLCAAYPGEALARLAIMMGITESTLRNLLSTTYVKLGVRNRAEAVLKAQSLGLAAGPRPPTPPSAGDGSDRF
jgi:DNA-binding NarL/FixJ family response regulator